MRAILTTAAVGCLLLQNLHAQGDDAPVGQAELAGDTLVVARKRAELLEDVPASITVLEGESLEQAGIQSVFDAALLVPNLSVTEFSARRLSFPFIRGIGSGQGEPAVVTYIDGVPQLTPGSPNFPFVDLDRVEFLRGPQGALYGRNALGGVIHLISERPGRERAGDVRVGFGDFGLQETQLSLSGPLGEEVSASFSFLASERDGYTENDATGHDVDFRDSTYGRLQVLFTPDEDSELRFGLYNERARDGGFVLSDITGLRDRPHHIDQDFEGLTERDVLSPSVTYTTRNKDVEITSITSWQDWEIFETSDFDFSSFDFVRRETREDQSTLYQEVRVTSLDEEQGALRWLVGFSGFLDDADRSAANEFRPGNPFLPPGTDLSSGAFEDLGLGLFGHVAWDAADDVELGLGLRWDKESKEVDLERDRTFAGFPVDMQSLDEDYSELVPQATLKWDVAEDVMLYGVVAKGFKAGGFNLNAPSGKFAYDTETSVTYEVGARHEWLDGALGMRVAAFFIDWEDMQLSQFDFATGGFVDNAGESTSQGLELEFDAEVTEHVDAFLNFGLVDTEFDEFTDSFGADAKGNSLAFAPENTWAVGAQYLTPLTDEMDLYLRGEFVGVGSFYYDAGNREEESYELVNLRAGVKRGNWSADVWMRNAGDEEYIPVAFQANPADASAFVGENGAPRTWGFSLRLSF